MRIETEEYMTIQRREEVRAEARKLRKQFLRYKRLLKKLRKSDVVVIKSIDRLDVTIRKSWSNGDASPRKLGRIYRYWTCPF